MDSEIFPWNPSKIPSAPALPEKVHPPSLSKKLLASLRPGLPYLAAVLVLLAAYAFTQGHSSETPLVDAGPQSVEVFTPLFAIHAGEDIPLDALRLVPVRKSLFTKTQLFGLMNPENIQELRGRLVAKRALPPNKAIFWHDLELKKAAPAQRKTQILYSGEGMKP